RNPAAGRNQRTTDESATTATAMRAIELAAVTTAAPARSRGSPVSQCASAELDATNTSPSQASIGRAKSLASHGTRLASHDSFFGASRGVTSEEFRTKPCGVAAPRRRPNVRRRDRGGSSLYARDYQ